MKTPWKAVPAMFAALVLATFACSGAARAEPGAGQAANSCGTRWYVAYSGSAPLALLYTDPDDTPLADLRFDFGLDDPLSSAGGFLDFNADGKSDVFGVKALATGQWQWRYAPGGSGAWVDLRADDTPLSQLRFAVFDGNNRTDVFTTQAVGNGVHQWVYAKDGLEDFAPHGMIASSVPLADLRMGFFQGTAIADVFTALPQANGSWHWQYSGGGTAAFANLAASFTPPGELLLGDFNADAFTDVFAALTPDAGGVRQWVYYAGGNAPYVMLTRDGTPPADLRLGDFNGDSKTDVFSVASQGDGLLQWRYAPGGTDANVNLLVSRAPLSNLRFGDFNGDKKTDVFVYDNQCAVYLPVVGKEQ